MSHQEQYLTYSGNEQTEQGNNALFYTNHQEQVPMYSSAGYSSLSEAYGNATDALQQQQTHQMGFMYTPTGGYVDAMSSSGPVVGMDNGMQSVDNFAAYT